MKKIYAAGFAAILSNFAFADASLPYGIVPLNGEIRLLFKPGFESTCTSKNESDPNDTPTKLTTRLFLDPNGRLKLETKDNDLSIIADINHDGSSVLADSFKFEFKDQRNNSFTEISQNDKALIEQMLKTVGEAYTSHSPIGKTLSQGSDLWAKNVCEMIPGGRTNFLSTFKKRVIGLAQIQGRTSLILQSDVNVSCVVAKIGAMDFSGYAWESYDLQSGLNSDSGGKMLLKMGNDQAVNMNVTTSCVIRATVQDPSTPSAHSVEQRLTELKSLVDKGLISQEQYEEKRADILKAL